MNGTWIIPTSWLIRSAIGGGLLLLAVWGLTMLTRQPARRQRLGEWGVLAALLAALLSGGPAWLPLRLDLVAVAPTFSLLSQRDSPPAPTPSLPNPFLQDSSAGAEEIAPGQPLDELVEKSGNWSFAEGNGDGQDATLPEPLAPKSQFARESAGTIRFAWLSLDKLAFGLMAIYVAGALLFTSRWLLGWFVLRRFLRRCQPAPEPVAALFAEMTRHRKRRPQLLQSASLRVPVSCGIWRPTVVVPAHFCAPASLPWLRWVFSHELTHLERRDPWSCLLFGLAQGVYFYCPWFWWLRRQVRLCQEFIADAAAAQQAEAAEDYAQFLVSLAEAPAGPRVAIGVVGNRSDLFRRVTMLLQNPVKMENRCPWRWSLATAAGLFAVAVLASGIGLRAADSGPEPSDPKAQASSAQEERAQRAEDKRDSVRQERITGAPDVDVEALRKALDKLPPGPEIDQLKKELLQKVKALKEKRGAAAALSEREVARPRLQRFVAVTPGGYRLGVQADFPGPALRAQLDLPKNQGLVLNQVFPDSPAAKAGLKANDILLELNGKPIPADPGAFANMVQEMKTDTPVDAVVLRKGKKEVVKGITLKEGKNELRVIRPGGPAGVPGIEARPVPPGGAGRGIRNVPVPLPVPGTPAFPPLQPFGRGFAPPNAVMVSVIRQNDRFTGRHQEGSLILTVTGNVTEGKAKVSEIHVQDGNTTEKYESLDKVPERYKDKAKNLIEMSEKGNVKVETGSSRIRRRIEVKEDK